MKRSSTEIRIPFPSMKDWVRHLPSELQALYLRELISERARAEPRRMWINQPSTRHAHNALHGTRVLACKEPFGGYRVYFLSGPTISMQMSALQLSRGWPE